MTSRFPLLALFLSSAASPVLADANFGYYAPPPPASYKSPQPYNACNPMPDFPTILNWVEAALVPHGIENLESMCSCLRTQQQYSHPHYSACAVPRSLQGYQATTVLSNCACFEQLAGLNTPPKSSSKSSAPSTAASTKPASSSTASSTAKPSSAPAQPSQYSSAKSSSSVSSATKPSSAPVQPSQTSSNKASSATSAKSSSAPSSAASQVSSGRSTSTSSTSCTTTSTATSVKATGASSAATSGAASSSARSTAVSTVVSAPSSVGSKAPSTVASGSSSAPVSTTAKSGATSAASAATSSTPTAQSSQAASVASSAGNKGVGSSTVLSSTAVSSGASAGSSGASTGSSGASAASTGSSAGSSIASSGASSVTPAGSATPSGSSTPGQSTVSAQGATSSPAASTTPLTVTPTVTTLAPSTSGTDVFDYLPGSTSTFDGPITLAPAPTATLTPAPPYGVDQGSPSVLVPQPLIQLWYGAPANQSANTSAVFTRLNITYQYPAVALDHSAYINQVSCSGSAMTASFNSSDFYSLSKSLWTANATMLWITAAPSCDNNSGNNVYFLCNAITCDDSKTACTATGTFQNLGDIIEMMDADFGSIQQGNSTQTPTGTGCGAAPASTISGLPAIACSTDFDKQLDDAMGYYSGALADTDAVMAQFAPSQAASRLAKKWSVKGAWNSVKSGAKAVVNTASNIGHAAVQIAQNPTKALVSGAKAAFKYVAAKVGPTLKAAASFAKAGLKSALNLGLAWGKTLYAAAKFLVTGNFDDDVHLPFNLGPPEFLLLESPFMNNAEGFKFYEWRPDPEDRGYKVWQNALEVISQDIINTNTANKPGIEFWCVDCGLQGDLRASGHVHVSLKGGLEEATLSLKGTMYAGLFLGVNAFATYNKTYTKPLFVAGLPGLSIPDVFSVGPYMELDIRAEARIDALGQAIAGGSFTWPAIDATLDLKNSSNTHASGFKPVMNATIQTTEQITLTLSLGLPITLAVGVDLLKGTYKKNINLTDTPALVATARWEEETNTTFADSCTSVDLTPTNQCLGVGYNVSAVNDVTLGLLGFDTFNLLHNETPVLISGCIGKNTTTNNITTTQSNCPDPSNSTNKTTTKLPTSTPASAAPISLAPFTTTSAPSKSVATSTPSQASTVTPLASPILMPSGSATPTFRTTSPASSACTASPTSAITNGNFTAIGSNVGFTVMPQPWTGSGGAFYFNCGSDEFDFEEPECFGPNSINYVQFLLSQDSDVNEHVGTITNQLTGLVPGQPYRLTVTEGFSNQVTCIMSYNIDGAPFRSFVPTNSFDSASNSLKYNDDVAWFVPTQATHALSLSMDCPNAGDNGGEAQISNVALAGPFCAADMPASASNAGCPAGIANGPHDNNEVLYSVACSAGYGAGTFLASSSEQTLDACMQWCNSWGGSCQSLSFQNSYCTLYSNKGTVAPGSGTTGATYASRL